MAVDFYLATAPELCLALAERLRERRLAQLLSQGELASRAGISTGALKKLEKDGQANVLTLVRVAQALGLVGDLDALFRLHPQASIAEMERAEEAKRKRAPRRTA